MERAWHLSLTDFIFFSMFSRLSTWSTYKLVRISVLLGWYGLRWIIPQSLWTRLCLFSRHYSIEQLLTYSFVNMTASMRVIGDTSWKIFGGNLICFGDDRRGSTWKFRLLKKESALIYIPASVKSQPFAAYVVRARDVGTRTFFFSFLLESWITVRSIKQRSTYCNSGLYDIITLACHLYQPSWVSRFSEEGFFALLYLYFYFYFF